MYHQPTYYVLFSKYKDHISKIRNVPVIGSVNYEQLCCVYSRAAQLTLLDIFLETYRKQHQSPFNDLHGKQALYHLLLVRTNWTLDYIKKMPLIDVLLVLHEDLKLEKFEPVIADYFEKTLSNYDNLNFSDVMDEEWKPELAEESQQHN